MVMKPNIGIPIEDTPAVVKILNRLLSDEFVLNTKTRNFHWNVVGPQFDALHKLFDSQYVQLDIIVDEVAERVRFIGGASMATLVEFVQSTRLKEQPGQYPGPLEMISYLLTDHETIIRTLRDDIQTCAEKYHDFGTSDFLTGLMEKHEKTAWMLRAHLEKAPAISEASKRVEMLEISR